MLKILCTVILFASLCSGETVLLTFAAKLAKARTVLIEGTTNLPDGALLEWDLEARNGETKHGPMKVKGGKFTSTVTVNEWRPGRVEVWVGFNTLIKGQPPEVVQRYGARGERLTGPNIIDKRILRQVEAKHFLVFPSTAASKQR